LSNIGERSIKTYSWDPNVDKVCHCDHHRYHNKEENMEKNGVHRSGWEGNLDYLLEKEEDHKKNKNTIGQKY